MNVVCLRCGEAGGVKVDVQDGDTLTCTGCDAEYTVAEVVAALESWRPLLPWLLAHPARTAEAATV